MSVLLHCPPRRDAICGAYSRTPVRSLNSNVAFRLIDPGNAADKGDMKMVGHTFLN